LTGHPSATHRILIVEDEMDVRAVLQRNLITLGYLSDIAEDAEKALERLGKESFDIVLVDICLPGMDGLALTRRIKSGSDGPDVIAMTGYTDRYSYIEVVSAGASDFIFKPFSRDELNARIERILRERRLRAELRLLSIQDGLTNLYNRRHLFERLPKEVARAKRQEHSLSCVLLDIDHFKEFNDTYGHCAGDQALSALAGIIFKSIRQNVDSAYRFGGDEFVIVLVETELKQALRIAERIRFSFQKEGSGRCTVSIGVVQLHPMETFEDLIVHADETLYKAKRAGGNRVQESIGSSKARSTAHGDCQKRDAQGSKRRGLV
jgi:two-component system cell cycle response regulator